ncbi:MAG: hypothetical protein ABW164_03900 [Sphingobium sp.]
MPLLMPLLLLVQAYDPEIEAVMRNRAAQKAAKGEAAAAQPAPAPVPATSPKPDGPLPVPPEHAARFQACVDAAVAAPDGGIAEAEKWRIEGGGFYARQCLGFAYARAERWNAAVVALEQAAEEAERGGERVHSARLWAQAGNAALASGNPARARDDLDAALARGLPDGIDKGEVFLDRARALVALGDLNPARESIDHALELVPQDPLGWLLSATLARRQAQMTLAQAHIARAVRMSPDDASVALEEGNIAILTDHEDVARAAWSRAARLAPDAPAGRAAADNLSRLPATTAAATKR